MVKGTRKSKKQVNSDKYMKLYEFLMFDPIYKNMSAEAKLLYAYLDKKIYMFEEKQKAYEEGEGTKSYEDENGDLFIIADNTELIYLLNCSEPTLIKFKKELDAHGLIEEESVKDSANRIYIMNPSVLSEEWVYIDEIKELRAKKKEDAAKRRLEMKKKRDQQKLENRMKKRQGIVKGLQKKRGDLKNLSHGKNNDLSSGEIENLSKNQSNVFKDQLNSLNTNQSINETIENSALPIALQKTLILKKDRLIDFQLNISDIEVHFNAVKENYSEAEYNFVLSSLLAKMTARPNVFADVMDKWLTNNRKRDIPEKKNRRGIIRTEMTPKHLAEGSQEENVSNAEKMTPEEFEAEKKKLFDRIKSYKQNPVNS